jgi:hypothetical protein
MKTLKIMANSSRDQEGYTDTQMGLSLDVECDLSDVGFFIVNLRQLEMEIKSLYPSYKSSEIEPDVQYREGTACHIFYRFDFSKIFNPNMSVLHNISSLASAFTAFKVAQLFRKDGYSIINDSNADRSDKEIAKEVCDDQFFSFLFYISDVLSENDNFVLFNGFETKSFLDQFENTDTLNRALNILGNECNGEFGFTNPMDNTLPFKEYNPFTISEKNSTIISNHCKNIKYSFMFEYFLSNIKEK